MSEGPQEARTASDVHPADPDLLVDALVQTAFMTVAELSRLGAQNDLSLTQVRVLAILRDRRVRMTGLAAYLGLDKSTMTGLVTRAEKRGLLQRIPGEGDRRAVDVVLTEAGKELTARVTVQVREALAPMVERLSPAERRRLQALLGRMIDADPAL